MARHHLVEQRRGGRQVPRPQELLGHPRSGPATEAGIAELVGDLERARHRVRLGTSRQRLHVGVVGGRLHPHPVVAAAGGDLDRFPGTDDAGAQVAVEDAAQPAEDVKHLGP
jgi:hypothetical protein